MSSARSKSSKKLLTLKQAAKLLAVSVDTLLSWNENHILKPTITEDGKIGYTEEQIDQFLRIRNFSTQEKKRPTFTSTNPSPTQSTNTTSEPTTSETQSTPKETFYHKFITWVGHGFYQDELIKNHLRSQVRESLTFSFKTPSKKTVAITASVITVLGIVAFTQQYRIKFLLEKYESVAGITQTGKGVLGEQTSKVKLKGKVIFALPLDIRDDVSMAKDLFVQGESIFTGNITAPNVIYSLKPGDNITISGLVRRE